MPLSETKCPKSNTTLHHQKTYREHFMWYLHCIFHDKTPRTYSIKTLERWWCIFCFLFNLFSNLNLAIPAMTVKIWRKFWDLSKCIVCSYCEVNDSYPCDAIRHGVIDAKSCQSILIRYKNNRSISRNVVCLNYSLLLYLQGFVLPFTL